MPTQYQFDASKVAPDAGRDILNAGWYNAAFMETEIKPTKAADGSFLLAAQATILDGYASGRKIFINYNIKNNNPTAEKIGQAQLSAAMHAMDYLAIQQHTGELHGKPFKVKLKIVPPVYEKDAAGNVTTQIKYEEKNEVVAYKKASEVVDMAQANAAGPGTGSPASAAPAGFNAASDAPVAPAGFPAAATSAPATVAAPAAPAATPAAVQQPWNTAAPAAEAPAPVAQPAAAPAVAAPAAGGTVPPWMTQPPQ